MDAGAAVEPHHRLDRSVGVPVGRTLGPGRVHGEGRLLGVHPEVARIGLQAGATGGDVGPPDGLAVQVGAQDLLLEGDDQRLLGNGGVHRLLQLLAPSLEAAADLLQRRHRQGAAELSLQPVDAPLDHGHVELEDAGRLQVVADGGQRIHRRLAGQRRVPVVHGGDLLRELGGDCVRDLLVGDQQRQPARGPLELGADVAVVADGAGLVQDTAERSGLRTQLGDGLRVDPDLLRPGEVGDEADDALLGGGAGLAQEPSLAVLEDEPDPDLVVACPVEEPDPLLVEGGAALGGRGLDHGLVLADQIADLGRGHAQGAGVDQRIESLLPG